MLTAVLLLMAQAPAPAPAPESAPPSAPVFKLTSATEKDGVVSLTFEVTNPNSVPMPYVGYTPDSFAPPIPDGTISPLYKVEALSGKEWKARPIGWWCGTGIGPVTIPAKGKVTFAAGVPPGDWMEARIGLVWFAKTDCKDPQTAWCSAIDRRDVKKGQAK